MVDHFSSFRPDFAIYLLIKLIEYIYSSTHAYDMTEEWVEVIWNLQSQNSESDGIMSEIQKPKILILIINNVPEKLQNNMLQGIHVLHYVKRS